MFLIWPIIPRKKWHILSLHTLSVTLIGIHGEMNSGWGCIG
jgi:hypothetical protein